ncbi:hypothetical protein, partial [Campylobacter sp.]|uniref:hypothetical protein n=1 Tax=Campylobacter sp. TaxID=205 RepID=UPI002AA8E248
MTQRILEFPSFLSAGSVHGCFLRVLAWRAAKYKGQRKSRIPKHNFLGILEFLSINLEFPK